VISVTVGQRAYRPQHRSDTQTGNLQKRRLQSVHSIENRPLNFNSARPHHPSATLCGRTLLWARSPGPERRPEYFPGASVQKMEWQTCDYLHHLCPIRRSKLGRERANG